MPEPKMFTEQEVKKLLADILEQSFDVGLETSPNEYEPMPVISTANVRSAFTSLLHPQEGSKA